jgi:hypothetical protein
MQFVSSVTQMIAANGISVRLAAGVPTHVPQALRALAMAKGVEPLGDEPAPAPVDSGASVEEVVAAIRALMEAGETGAFGTTGEPKLNALKKKVGKNVTDAVRDAAWAQVKTEE